MKTTSAMSVYSSLAAIQQNIILTCPTLRDKIEVLDGSINEPAYYVDGRDLIIKFSSYVGDPPQFTI